MSGLVKWINHDTWNILRFLVADTQLYKRLCPSIGPSVGPSVRPCQRVEKWETSGLEAFCVCVCVGRGVGWSVGCGWGLAAPAHPSATILWPRVTCCLAFKLKMTCETFYGLDKNRIKQKSYGFGAWPASGPNKR